MIYDGGWRFFGVALPGGLMVGLGAYVTLSAFIHPDLGWQRSDLPRQLLIITLLATIAAHFIEIHFGIAIAATRTYFWVMTALLLVLGMRWAQPAAYTIAQEDDEAAPDAREPRRHEAAVGKRNRSARKPQHQRRHASTPAPVLPTTIMIDLLIFLTTVFIYTTNSQRRNQRLRHPVQQHLRNAWSAANRLQPRHLLPADLHLADGVYPGPGGRSAATAACARCRLVAARLSVSCLIVWGGWLVYGLIEGCTPDPRRGRQLHSTPNWRMSPGHFAVFTWLLVVWLVAAGTVLAWRWLRSSDAVAVFGNAALSLGAGRDHDRAHLRHHQLGQYRRWCAPTSSTNRASSSTAQGNWVSSIELYRRASSARRTEDHYMLFLGRGAAGTGQTADRRTAPLRCRKT